MFNNFATLKKAVVRLYKVWVLEEAKGGAVSKDSAKYYALKRSLLEQKYDSLKIKQVSSGKNLQAQSKTLIKENVSLLFDINGLQRAKHALSLDLKIAGVGTHQRI